MFDILVPKVHYLVISESVHSFKLVAIVELRGAVDGTIWQFRPEINFNAETTTVSI